MLKLKKVFLDDINNLPFDTETLYIKTLRINDNDNDELYKFTNLNLPVCLKNLIIDGIESGFIMYNELQCDDEIKDAEYFDDLLLEHIEYIVKNIKLPFGCNLTLRTISYGCGSCPNLMVFHMNNKTSSFPLCKTTGFFSGAKEDFEELKKSIFKKYKISKSNI
jgi:hypothetical protein